MLDPWIIEEIRRKERERDREQQVELELPLERYHDPPPALGETLPPEEDRGVVIIDI